MTPNRAEAKELQIKMGRGDELHARSGIPQLGDDLIHLMTRQLASFTRFRSLRHLDLQLFRIDEVMRRDAESG